MEIKINSLVKIICQNNLVEGGKVLEYTKNQLVLQLIDGDVFIIQNPYKNIIAIRLMKAETKSQNPVFVEKDIKTQLSEEDILPKENLNVKTLAELHKLKAAEERKRAKDLLTTKTISNTFKEVNFGYPNFTKPPVFNNSKKKTR